MNTQTQEALKMAISSLNDARHTIFSEWYEKHDAALNACKEALESQEQINEFNPDWDGMAVLVEQNKELAMRIEELESQEPKCSEHPDAPHGFCRGASHSADRYVCECEGWEAPSQEQEPSTLAMAGYDLDGVIADGYREGLDDVCLNTIKRVRKIISEYDGIELKWYSAGYDDGAKVGSSKMETTTSQEQEPLGFIPVSYKCNLMSNNDIYPIGALYRSKKRDDDVALYTHPAQPLSDDEIYSMADECYSEFEGVMGKGFVFDRVKFARAIEKAHGIA